MESKSSSLPNFATPLTAEQTAFSTALVNMQPLIFLPQSHNPILTMQPALASLFHSKPGSRVHILCGKKSQLSAKSFTPTIKLACPTARFIALTRTTLHICAGSRRDCTHTCTACSVIRIERDPDADPDFVADIVIVCNDANSRLVRQFAAPIMAGFNPDMVVVLPDLPRWRRYVVAANARRGTIDRYFKQCRQIQSYYN